MNRSAGAALLAALLAAAPNVAAAEDGAPVDEDRGDRAAPPRLRDVPSLLFTPSEIERIERAVDEGRRTETPFADIAAIDGQSRSIAASSTGERTRAATPLATPSPRAVHLSAVIAALGGGQRVWLNGAALEIGDRYGDDLVVLSAENGAARLEASIGGERRIVLLQLNQTLDLNNGTITEGRPASWAPVRLR